MNIEKIKAAALAAIQRFDGLSDFYSLANPSAVLELIDRLEAAEHTEHCHSIEYGDLRDSYDYYKAQCSELQKKLEAAEKRRPYNGRAMSVQEHEEIAAELQAKLEAVMKEKP